MSKPFWTEEEQVKVAGNIIVSGLLENTKRKTNARKQASEKLVDKFIVDPDFSARLKSDNPRDTILQHIRVWVSHIEDGGKKPPLKRR